MTLTEMKKKVLKLIEETSEDVTKLTDDEDFENKLNEVINQIMFELARYKKMPAYEILEVENGEEIELDKEFKNFYQLNIIKGVDYESFGNTIFFNETGKAKVYYYKYPKLITDDNEANYKFEQTEDVLQIAPYGIAADLLKSDVSNQYGQIYANRYTELKQNLDPRYDTGSAHVEGGIDV